MAVERSMEPPHRPMEIKAADCDLVLATNALKEKLAFLVRSRHVYGHQDSTAGVHGPLVGSGSGESLGDETSRDKEGAATGAVAVARWCGGICENEINIDSNNGWGWRRLVKTSRARRV